jgi:hypothetical protein
MSDDLSKKSKLYIKIYLWTSVSFNKAKAYRKLLPHVVKPEDAFVDRGYRGKENHPKDTRIFIFGTKRLPDTLKKLLRARSGIEPIIGHLKEDHGLSRNHLLGKAGDMINAVLTGCAFNLRKIMRLLPPATTTA